MEICFAVEYRVPLSHYNHGPEGQEAISGSLVFLHLSTHGIQAPSTVFLDKVPRRIPSVPSTFSQCGMFLPDWIMTMSSRRLDLLYYEDSGSTLFSWKSLLYLLFFAFSTPGPCSLTRAEAYHASTGCQRFKKPAGYQVCSSGRVSPSGSNPAVSGGLLPKLGHWSSQRRSPCACSGFPWPPHCALCTFCCPVCCCPGAWYSLFQILVVIPLRCLVFFDASSRLSALWIIYCVGHLDLGSPSGVFWVH